MDQGTAVKWRSFRGRKGVRWAASGRGHLIEDTGQRTWYFAVGRGDGQGAWDWWGPLAADDEAAAFRAARQMEKRLERVGWFALTKTTGGWSALHACLEKMPRQYVPTYFLSALDNQRAAAGQAQKGGVLHVGGIDIHRWRSQAVDAGLYPDCDATLVLTPAGQKPAHRNPKAFWLKVGAAELDALISHLMDIRLGLVTEETFDASAEAISDEMHGSTRVPAQMQARFQRVQQKSALLNRALSQLATLPLEQLATLVEAVESLDQQANMPRGAIAPLQSTIH